MKLWKIALTSLILFCLCLPGFGPCDDDDDDDDDSGGNPRLTSCENYCTKLKKCTGNEFEEIGTSVEDCVDECENRGREGILTCNLNCNMDASCEDWNTCVYQCAGGENQCKPCNFMIDPTNCEGFPVYCKEDWYAVCYVGCCMTNQGDVENYVCP